MLPLLASVLPAASTPMMVFFFGLFILGLFIWYFVTELPRRKRQLALGLTLVLVTFCADSFIPLDEKVQLGIDLKGGTSFLIELTPENGQTLSKDILDQAVKVIRKRVDANGTGETVITPVGLNRIQVQIPGLDPANIVQTRQRLAKVAKLELKILHEDSFRLIPAIENGSEMVPTGFRVQEYSDTDSKGKKFTRKVVIRQRAAMTGENITRAGAYYGQRGWEINIEFNSKGAADFAKITTENTHRQMGIVLDNEILSAPNINEPITGGRCQITGSFTEQQARDLAGALENPLQVPVKIVEERSVSSTLGADSIRSGLLAGLYGLVALLVFTTLYYRLAGLIACIGLVVNIVLLLGVMCLFGFVLTLPGIAGVILLLGIAIDSNVLIYERLREELAAGKSLRLAIDAAYSRAFLTIFDANMTTLLTSAILFYMSSGTIQGFAVTLTAGIVCSMFSALLFTRNLFDWGVSFGWIKSLSFASFFSHTNIDFLGRRRLFISVSIALALLSLAAGAIKREHALGIDFLGGDLVRVQNNGKLNEESVRADLAPLNLPDLQVQREKSPDAEYFAIRAPFGAGDSIIARIKEAHADTPLSFGQSEKIGSAVGAEMARTSALALLIGMAGILIYVAIRFEFSFAIGAIVALAHDVVIAMGLFVLMGGELSLVTVGAILTVAGYSINDTIVVYDRIREKLASQAKGAISTLMNESINETLSRTILTSGTTLLTVLCLYLFGGPVIHDFALIILIGIVVGTYSSIFIASPIVLWWSHRNNPAGLRAELAETEKRQKDLLAKSA